MQETKELEEMKRQYQLLKEKLERQTVINDKLLRNRLKSVTRTINFSSYASLIVAIVMTPVTYIVFREMNISLALWITLVIIMFSGTIIDCMLLRNIRDIQHHDLATAGRQLSMFRIKHLRYERASFFVALIFFAFFFYELLQNWQLPQLTTGIIFMAITLTASIMLNEWFHKQIAKLQKQIEETTENE